VRVPQQTYLHCWLLRQLLQVPHWVEQAVQVCLLQQVDDHVCQVPAAWSNVKKRLVPEKGFLAV
jgi:hypothetical protein